MNTLIKDRQPSRQHFVNCLAVTLIWAPATLFTLFNYYKFTQANVLLAYARALGLSHSSELGLGQLLLVFGETLLFVGVAIPVITFLAAYFVSLKAVARVVLVLAVALVVLNFINLITVANTGSLMTWELLVESALTARSEPDLAKEYVSASSIIKASVIVLAVFVSYFLVRYVSALNLTRPMRQVVSFLALGWLCIFPSLYAFAKLTTESELNAGVEFVSKQIYSMINAETKGSLLYQKLSVNESVALFQRSSGAPDLSVASDYAGAEAGSNLIIISLETSPSQVMNFGEDPEFSGLRELAARSFVAEQHHSTYPYTSDALFSVFTSLYPNELRRHLLTETAVKFENRLDEGRIGIFHALRQAGYSTKVYLPSESPFTNDKLMFGVLGADQVYVPSKEIHADVKWAAAAEKLALALPGYHLSSSNEKLAFERKARNDLISLEVLLADIKENADGGKRFAAVFLPLLGHGPWPDLRPERSLLETGRDIFLIQDKWIKEIYDVLESEGIADNTVIAITADHGLRTSQEYAELRPGILNAISFQVPLLIYAPNALNQEVRIPHLTSHIDIAPSILSLLGIESEDMIALGSPVWDARLENRRTYLLASDYLGVDGYYENHKFSMYQEMSRSIMISDELYSRDASSPIEYKNAGNDDSAPSILAEQASFQRRLKTYLLESTQSGEEL